MHIVTINDFTESEKRLLVFAWLCFDVDPKVDLHKLANLAGMTNTGSAGNAWGRIRRKLRGESVVAPKPRAKKRAANEEDDGPMKKAKVAGKPKKAKTETVDYQTGSDDGFLDGIEEYAE